MHVAGQKANVASYDEGWPFPHPVDHPAARFVTAGAWQSHWHHTCQGAYLVPHLQCQAGATLASELEVASDGARYADLPSL